MSKTSQAELLVKILQKITDNHEQWKAKWGPNLRITVGKGNPLRDFGIEKIHDIEVEASWDTSILHEDGTETKIEGAAYTVTPIRDCELEEGDW
ncbi:hypothetical protein LRQ08_21625 [Rhodococcus qingshengii]|uniref:hypothetical protein n=1 Tax=Rhodococcus qingshengii TaxID=334542 RepID=UPI002111BCDD|nr:hypothetical protein [Rhodococcus qingshengii]UUE23829.1 hypothetical protein LRQ08_21625 [Rhodococcus qingshengii]